MRPQDRLSPRNRLSPPITIICGTPRWTVARFAAWDGEPDICGFCWNGDINDPNDKGNPRSHGEGTWTVLPAELVFAIEHCLPMINLLIKFVSKVERRQQNAA